MQKENPLEIARRYRARFAIYTAIIAIVVTLVSIFSVTAFKAERRACLLEVKSAVK